MSMTVIPIITTPKTAAEMVAEVQAALKAWHADAMCCECYNKQLEHNCLVYYVSAALNEAAYKWGAKIEADKARLFSNPHYTRKEGLYRPLPSITPRQQRELDRQDKVQAEIGELEERLRRLRIELKYGEEEEEGR